MKRAMVLTLFTLFLSGCGTSHLNCDTSENEALLFSAVTDLIDEYLELDKASVYPTLSVTRFNQHIIDVNAKKCDYVIEAHFNNSNAVLKGIPVSVVYRSTGTGGKSHELREFSIDNEHSINLGIAARKDNR